MRKRTISGTECQASQREDLSRHLQNDLVVSSQFSSEFLAHDAEVEKWSSFVAKQRHTASPSFRKLGPRMALTLPKLQGSRQLLDLLQAQTTHICRKGSIQKLATTLLRRICLTRSSYEILHIITKGGRPEQLCKRHTSLQPYRYDTCNLYVLVTVTLVCGQTHAQYFQQVERFKDAWLVSDKPFLFVWFVEPLKFWWTSTGRVERKLCNLRHFGAVMASS